MVRKAQIWIEAAVYSVLVLAIIAVILSFVIPRINSAKDKVLIENSISILSNIDKLIFSVQQATGNTRIIEIKLLKGNLIINTKEEKIIWNYEENSYIYSEPGKSVNIGNIIVNTRKASGSYPIEAILDYSKSNLNFTYNNEEKIYYLVSSPTPYKLLISNKGLEDSKTKIDFSSV